MLDGVAEIQADVIADLHARGRERVRQPGRALVELGVGAPIVAAHDRLARGHRVGDALEQIRDVELHARSSAVAGRSYSPILA